MQLNLFYFIVQKIDIFTISLVFFPKFPLCNKREISFLIGTAIQILFY